MFAGMVAVREASPLIQVHEPTAGALAYEVAVPPAALPPVRARDLAAAWDAAGLAATRGAPAASRLIRFRRDGGHWTVLALRDRDAACWATGVEQVASLRTSYGMSLCLRLLALVSTIAAWGRGGGLRAGWLADGRPGPDLLKAASSAVLTPDAGFDTSFFGAPHASHHITPIRFGATACP